MKATLALLGCSVLLSGCAHNCLTATFYKPETEADRRLSTDYSAPTNVHFALGGASFTSSVCGDRYLAPPGNVAAICISVEIDESTVMQFSEPTVRLSVNSAQLSSLQMGNVEYEILCQIKQGNRICTSSEESPASGTLTKVSVHGAVERFGFLPTAQFRGAADTLNEGSWFGHRLTGKRRYFIRTTALPIEVGAELTVFLPQVVLNGEKIIPPTLKFRAVTEEVCRTVVLQ